MSIVSRRRLIVLLAIPALTVLAAFLVTIAPYTKYTRGIYELLAFVLAADLAAALIGKWRDAATVVAAVIFGLASLELVAAAFEAPGAIEPRGFGSSNPVLGWAPAKPGLYHASKTAPDGKTVYAVDYTINDHLIRQTQSAPSGPTIAFFGDSFTFGQGLRDSETLPQIYADMNDRKIRVLNFGFPGYGPQQFLRALETGHFDPLLKDAKVFVYETAAWHAERSACIAGFVGRAPRYDLENGKLVYKGACVQGLNAVFHSIFMDGAFYQMVIAPLVNVVHHADVEIYLAEMQRCAELVKEKYNDRLVVLYLGDNAKYLAKSGFTDAMIEDRMRSAGMDVIDATLSAKDFPPGTELAIPGDGHPSAFANRVRAKLLQAYFEASAEKGAISLK